MINIHSIVLALFLTFCVPQAQADDHATAERPVRTIFDRQEELTYSVSWMSINIGTITLKLQPNGDGDSTISASAVIDSRDGLPFADVHAVFKGVLNKFGVPEFFIGYDKKEKGQWSVLRYDYSKERTLALVKKGTAKDPDETDLELTAMDTLSIDTMTQDGLSVFYFGRQHLRSLDTFSVKTIVQGNIGTTELNYYGKRSRVEIDAVDYPLDVIELDGMARFKGVFGLSGEFKGWFSNDRAHIPIRAKLGVILGNVNLELIRWKREGWTPPRYDKNISSK
jgi:hypothetical protein